MDIRAVAFDVNGTLVRILTEDGMEQIFRSAAHFLTYQGIDLHRHQVRDLYFGIMEEQQRTSSEEHPEFDAVGIWRSIIEGHMTDFTRTLPVEKLEQMPLFLAEMSRGISRRKLRLYPHVREVLDVLRERYRLALVTDVQSAYTRGELHKVGLLDYFDPIIVSGDHGYRKPDRRLFLAVDVSRPLDGCSGSRDSCNQRWPVIALSTEPRWMTAIIRSPRWSPRPRPGTSVRGTRSWIATPLCWQA
jgi:putative hydrolase of the HAD superfamily